MAIGEEEEENVNSPSPTMLKRELMRDGLYNTTFGKKENDGSSRDIDTSRRGLAKGLREAVLGKDSFYSPPATRQPEWNVFESNETSTRSRMEFRDFPDGIVHGASLWQVGLDDLPLDPFTLGAQVIEEIVNNISDFLPSEADIKSVISGIFDALTFLASGASSVANAIEGLFQKLRSILTRIKNIVQGILQKGANFAASTLSGKFNGAEEFPNSGDFIYTSAFGNVYNVFEVGEEVRGDANPSQNTVFSVPFNVSIAGESRSYFAIATFPVPNVEKLISSIFNFLISMISKVIAKGISGAIVAIFNGAVKGLKHLYEWLKNLLDLLKDLVLGLLDDLRAFLLDKWNLLKDLFDAYVLENAKQLAEMFQKIVDMIALLDFEPREINYIASDDGYGYRQMILVPKLSPPPINTTRDVDWRQVDYIHPTGATLQTIALVRITDAAKAGPVNNGFYPDYELAQHTICENGSEKNVQMLMAEETADFAT
jgi:hypothetical protein